MSGDFDFNATAAVLDPETFRRFCQRLAGSDWTWIARLFDGHLIYCSVPEVVHAGDQQRLRVAEAVGVLAGRVFHASGDDLVLSLPPGHAEAWLVLDQRVEPLSGTADCALQERRASARLALSSNGHPAMRVARVNWAPSASVAGRWEASVDWRWWPATVWARSDPRSLKALEELSSHVADPPAPLISLLTDAAGGLVGWPQLLAEVLRYAEDYWRAAPPRVAELRRVARSTEVADRVSGLIALFRSDHAGLLPRQLPTDPGCRLLQTLQPVEAATSANGDGLSVTHAYCGTAHPGLLAMAIDGPPGRFYRVTLRCGESPVTFVRRGAQGAEALAPVPARQEFAVQIHDPNRDATKPPAIALGLYAKGT